MHSSQIGSQFAVVDLGGSTVDITVFSVDQIQPKLVLREAKMSACVSSIATPEKKKCN